MYIIYTIIVKKKVVYPAIEPSYNNYLYKLKIRSQIRFNSMPQLYML